MKSISLKMDNSIFEDTEKIISKLKKARNRYINEAIEHYNNIQHNKILQQKLEEESNLVAAESMKVLKEFENLD